MRTTILALIAMAGMTPLAMQAAKESSVVDRLDASTDVLQDMMKASDKGIPQDLMNKAQCVVIIPSLKKLGFIFAGKYGRGFATCRRANGVGWTAPAPIRLEGGSVGFQIGGTEQDVVLLVMNGTGMKHLLSDKFTVGGEASAAAGPVGRTATAQTDAEMHAEMLSYSRSRGIFGGVSLDGSTMRPDADAIKELYGGSVTNKEILQGNEKTPSAADKLERLLDKNSSRKG